MRIKSKVKTPITNDRFLNSESRNWVWKGRPKGELQLFCWVSEGVLLARVLFPRCSPSPHLLSFNGAAKGLVLLQLVGSREMSVLCITFHFKKKKRKEKSASKTLVFFLPISMDSNFPLSPNPSKPLLLSVLHVIWGRGNLSRDLICWPDLLCFVMKSIYCLLKPHTSYGKNIHGEIISILSSSASEGGPRQAVGQGVVCPVGASQSWYWACITLAKGPSSFSFKDLPTWTIYSCPFTLVVTFFCISSVLLFLFPDPVFFLTTIENSKNLSPTSCITLSSTS